MGHKIFISYKYKDNHVYDKSSTFFNTYTYTVRNYVDELEKKFDSSDNIYKGESDGEDLSKLADSTIWEKLKDRIYDSTLTIVMLSKGMREIFKEEKYQWIPREISYSLSENSRKDKNGNPITSHTNALLAIIIPDETNSYSYFVTNKTCCNTNCLYYDRSNIFNIMSNNMFNQKKPSAYTCEDGSYVYSGDFSYMLCVKWDDFLNDINGYINKAYEIMGNINEYTVYKDV